MSNKLHIYTHAHEHTLTGRGKLEIAWHILMRDRPRQSKWLYRTQLRTRQQPRHEASARPGDETTGAATNSTNPLLHIYSAKREATQMN